MCIPFFPTTSTSAHKSQNPSGSSSGGCVGVTSGFAPFSIGTELDGSITRPAARAALYGLKPTLGSVDLSGSAAGQSMVITAGPITKCPEDLLGVLEVIMDGDDRKQAMREEFEKYTKEEAGFWGSVGIAVLEHEG